MLTLEGVRRNLVGGVVDGCVEARAPEAAALLPAHVKGRAVARFVGDHFWRLGVREGREAVKKPCHVQHTHSAVLSVYELSRVTHGCGVCESERF